MDDVVLEDDSGEEGDEGGHLDGGFELAEEGSGNGNFVPGGHHAHTVDGEVANYNNGKYPDGSHINIDQYEKSKVDEHFVSERVEEGAEVGDFFAFAGPDAVDFVGNGCCNEDDKCHDARPVVGQESENHKNDR